MNHFPFSKSKRELENMNNKRNGKPEGRFCNGLCQQFLDLKEFYPNDRHYPRNLCRVCNSYRIEKKSLNSKTDVTDQTFSDFDKEIQAETFPLTSSLIRRSSPISSSPIRREQSFYDFPIVANELENLRKELKMLRKTEKKYIKLLEKRSYHKFEKGPALYVLEVHKGIFKIGYDDVDVNTRFRTYRTLVPNFVIKFIAYTRQAKLLEQIALLKFSKDKLENNHEVLINLDINLILDTIKSQISFLDIEATIVSEEDLNEYNKH